MFMSVSAETKRGAQQLLTRPDLYEYYLNTIASPYVKAKTERGKKACFRLWKADIEFQANYPTEVKA